MPKRDRDRVQPTIDRGVRSSGKLLGVIVSNPAVRSMPLPGCNCSRLMSTRLSMLIESPVNWPLIRSLLVQPHLYRVVGPNDQRFGDCVSDHVSLHAPKFRAFRFIARNQHVKRGAIVALHSRKC